MENLNSGDIREICDTVQESVMNAVRQNLSNMRPELLDSITNSVERRFSKKIKDQEQRIQLIEDKCKQQEKRIHQLESQLGEIKKTHSSKTNLPKSQDFSDNVANQKEIDVSRIYGFKYNGWIFYANKEMADFLYKVREDGSCNTQLTDYSVIGCFKISNSCLQFTDSDCNDRKIKLD